LVRQLLEYKKIKDAAALLEAQAERQLCRLPRFPVEATVGGDPASQPLRAVELWDLVSAFGRLMRETLALQPNQIVVDETPMQVYMDLIMERLTQASRMPFIAFFTPPLIAPGGGLVLGRAGAHPNSANRGGSARCFW